MTHEWDSNMTQKLDASDPRYHQAVAHESSADHREGEVMEEFARGYALGDRLLRPAMVKVAKA